MTVELTMFKDPKERVHSIVYRTNPTEKDDLIKSIYLTKDGLTKAFDRYPASIKITVETVD